VGGYDERLQQYGWDDSNMYERMEAFGARARNFTRRDASGEQTINHIPHPVNAVQGEAAQVECS
jgi:hypothetical protein